MTEASAKNLILTSALVTGSVTVASKMLPKHEITVDGKKVNVGGQGQFPSPRILIGTAFAFTALAMLAPYAPNFTGMWALLLLTISLLQAGGPMILGYLNQ